MATVPAFCELPQLGRRIMTSELCCNQREDTENFQNTWASALALEHDGLKTSSEPRKQSSICSVAECKSAHSVNFHFFNRRNISDCEQFCALKKRETLNRAGRIAIKDPEQRQEICYENKQTEREKRHCRA